MSKILKKIFILFCTIALLLGLSIFFYDKIFRKRLKKHGQTISIGHTEMLRGIQEGFSGFKEIKIFGKNQFFKKIAIDGANKAANSQINAGVLKRAPAFLFEFIIISFIVLNPKFANISLTSCAINVNKFTIFSGVPLNFSLSFVS